MSLVDAIILGIIQGLTEFLPISSSGHLVIAQKLLGIEVHDLAFDLAAHLGTLLSIVTIYFVLLRKLMLACAKPVDVIYGRGAEARFVQLVIIGSLPTAAIGLGFRDQFEQMFNDMTSLGWCFILSGGILLLSKIRGGARFTRDQLLSLSGVEHLNWWRAALIGVAQGLAIAPSISRSGITIVTALLLAVPGPTAAMYSFILSLPAVAGAAVLELKDVPWQSSRVELLVVGMVTAYLAGLLGLWGTLQAVRKGRLEVFTLYMVAVGVVILWAWT